MAYNLKMSLRQVRTIHHGGGMVCSIAANMKINHKLHATKRVAFSRTIYWLIKSTYKILDIFVDCLLLLA